MVYLKLQPFAQTLVAHRSCAKRTFKYFGSFKIVDKTGSTAYKLLLPELAVIHPVFHVSQLKQHIPNFAPVFTELPPAAFSEVLPPNPESILDRRLVKKGASAVTQVLIKWTGLPTEMSSWEDYNVIKTMFPHSIHLGTSWLFRRGHSWLFRSGHCHDDGGTGDGRGEWWRRKLNTGSCRR